MRLFAALFSLALLVVATAMPAGAQDTPPPVKGMFLLTDYPAVTVRPGTTTTINLRLRNYALPPERFALAVDGVPSGWTVTLLGGGQPAGGRDGGDQRPAPRCNCGSTCRRTPPMGTQNLTVTAKGQSTELTLPIAVTLAKDLPAKLTVEPELPSLRGTSKSNFEYQLKVKNDSGRNLVVALGGAGAAELRDELHRAVRQPGAVLDPGRGRPVQDRQAQGAPAEHDRRQPLSGLGEGLRRGRHRRRQRRARDHRPAASCRWPAATAC